MLYAQRDESGKIISIFNRPREGAAEEVSHKSDEVIEFFLDGASEEETKTFLSKTDLEMVRIVEDLIDLLMKKNLILLTDLPAAAQQKLISRKRIRENINDNAQLLIDEDTLF
jgi:hypothetical protein